MTGTDAQGPYEEQDPYEEWEPSHYQDFPPDWDEEELSRLEWLEQQPIPDVWFPSHVEPVEDDVDVDKIASKMENEILREKRLANDETHQRLGHQKFFFYFSLLVIGIPVIVASVGFFVLVLRDNGVGDVTYAAFFASVVAEVIGLSYILGNYFFPNTKNNGGDKNQEEGS